MAKEAGPLDPLADDVTGAERMGRELVAIDRVTGLRPRPGSIVESESGRMGFNYQPVAVYFVNWK